MIAIKRQGRDVDKMKLYNNLKNVQRSDLENINVKIIEIIFDTIPA